MTQQQLLGTVQVGQTWKSDRTGETFTVKAIRLDQWIGAYIADFTDGSWVKLESLVRNAEMMA